MVKNPPANAWDIRDAGVISGLGRPPGEGNGTPLQYSCLGNAMDGGAWLGYSPWGHKESGTTEATEYARMHILNLDNVMCHLAHLSRGRKKK